LHGDSRRGPRLHARRRSDQHQAQVVAEARKRREVVPGASHFAAMRIANPSWASYPQVATIDDHTFFRVNRLRSRDETSDAAGTAGGSR
jgi:hypothetical protein